MPGKKTTRVAFCRVNRRTDGQATLDLRPFRDDMIELAQSHKTYADIDGRRWLATDMEVRDEGQAMVGLLGFEVSDQFRPFEEAEFSWLKGSTYMYTGAQEDTVVPFAVDLRDHRRWVSVATSSRIQHLAFATGLKAVLNEAVQQLGLLPTDWQVDPVTNRSNVLDWVAAHPNIKVFRRTLKFPNPGRRLDDDRREMRALGAQVEDREVRALGGHRLNLQGNPLLPELLEGMERGDVEVYMESSNNGVMERYTSRDRPDETFVDAFEEWPDGMDRVLDALRIYSSQQAREAGIA